MVEKWGLSRKELQKYGKMIHIEMVKVTFYH